MGALANADLRRPGKSAKQPPPPQGWRAADPPLPLPCCHLFPLSPRSTSFPPPRASLCCAQAERGTPRLSLACGRRGARWRACCSSCTPTRPRRWASLSHWWPSSQAPPSSTSPAARNVCISSLFPSALSQYASRRRGGGGRAPCKISGHSTVNHDYGSIAHVKDHNRSSDCRWNQSPCILWTLDVISPGRQGQSESVLGLSLITNLEARKL